MLLQQPIFRRKKNHLMGRVCREECQHCTYVEVGQTSFSLTKKLVNAIFVVSGRGKKLLRQAVYEIGGFPTHRFFARKSLWSGESLSAKLVSNFFNSHPLTTPEGMNPRLTPQPLPIKFEKEGR